MRRGVRRPDPSAEFLTPERCHILELSGAEDDAEVSIARARVEPGVTTQLHALDGMSERYVVVAGTGEMEVDGESLPVGPGDVVLIPPGVPQRVANTGDEDLVFYCVCTPAWHDGAYRALE